MSIAETFLPEFDREIAVTRSLLERVPDADLAWKPHEKSMSLGQLASHIANMVHWTGITLRETEFDGNPPDGPPVPPMAALGSTAAIVDEFEKNVRDARAALEAASDEDFAVHWALKNGGNVIFSMPRSVVVRSFVLNHLIHHRGQLSVYLRLRDVPLPSIYGPSADAPM